MPYALVFPGQGAQEVGMGKDLFEQYPESRAVFEEADDALGFSLSQLIWQGPEEELVKTAIAQPAIMAVSIAAMRALEKECGHALAPLCAAGHSLGEYTALVAGGALSLADGLRLVHARGSWMQEAVPLGQGAMSAVIGLDFEAVNAVCREAQGICSPANVNAPTQIVISGEAEAVARAGVIAKEQGASKVIPLKVSAPFHSELMRPVADKLRERFAEISWNDPSFPIVANVDAEPVRTADEARERIYTQTFSPVLWVKGVLTMQSLGADLFLELGPGNVLSGLIKRIIKGAAVSALAKAPDVANAKNALGAAQ